MGARGWPEPGAGSKHLEAEAWQEHVGDPGLGKSEGNQNNKTHTQQWVEQTDSAPHQRPVGGGVPTSGPGDYLLRSLLLYRKQAAFNHKSGDTEQGKNYPMSKRRDAATSPECTLAETLIILPRLQGPAVPRTRPRAVCRPPLAPTVPPAWPLPDAVLPTPVPGTSRACCLLSQPSSERPAIFLPIPSFFSLVCRALLLTPITDSLTALDVKKEEGKAPHLVTCFQSMRPSPNGRTCPNHQCSVSSSLHLGS